MGTVAYLLGHTDTPTQLQRADISSGTTDNLTLPPAVGKML